MSTTTVAPDPGGRPDGQAGDGTGRPPVGTRTAVRRAIVAVAAVAVFLLLILPLLLAGR